MKNIELTDEDFQRLGRISKLFEGFKTLSSDKQQAFFGTLEAQINDTINKIDSDEGEQFENFLIDLRDLFKSVISK